MVKKYNKIDIYLNVSLVVICWAGELGLLSYSLAEDEALLEQENVQFFSLVTRSTVGYVTADQRFLEQQLALSRDVALKINKDRPSIPTSCKQLRRNDI